MHNKRKTHMCNIMAAVGGIALLALLGGNKKKKETEAAPMLPQIQTKYSSEAKSQANINQGLASDASSGISTSSEITSSKGASPSGGSNYRNQLSIPSVGGSKIGSKLPTIGGLGRQKPVNF
jgi:hypothetical protein